MTRHAGGEQRAESLCRNTLFRAIRIWQNCRAAAAAPFKVGGRKNDPASVRVEKGQLTFRNAADLYLYPPNTLVVVKASGKEVKEWLECSAGQFNQIDITAANHSR